MLTLLALLLAASCGVERAEVKHMADDQAGVVNTHPTKVTIGDLLQIQAPDPPIKGHEARGMSGADAEWSAYEIEGAVIVAKLEADQDIHIGLSDGAGHTMVVESVAPQCAKGSILLDEIKAAREQVRRAAGWKPGRALTTGMLKTLVGKRVRVSGIGFSDVCTTAHFPEGASPHCLELHPLTSFQVLP